MPRRPRVFISYRRSDTQMAAGRLRESLARVLGDEAIFRDRDSIAPGEDWRQAIQEGLGRDVLVLALIGPGWAAARNQAGALRLADPADPNRLELELAFRQKYRVIPLLVDETKMPDESELPDGLKPLARANALPLRDSDWQRDVDRLVQTIGALGGRSRALKRGLIAGAVVIVLGVGIALWLSTRSPAVPDRPAGERPAVQTPPRDAPAAAGLRADVVKKLTDDQYRAMDIIDSDAPRALRMIHDNLAEIDERLRTFPDEPDLHALAGYGAKNAYAFSQGVLTDELRLKYLQRARAAFERALQIDPANASALNGMGNVLFFEGRYDEAIEHHLLALKEAGGKYPAAESDLKMVRQAKARALIKRKQPGR